MKHFLTSLVLAAVTVMVLVSCSEEKRRKALLPNISGKAGEVVVVIGQNDWEGSVGTILRDSLSCDFPQLPQREPMFTLVNVPQAAFNSMFQIHRNIIIINISKDVTEPGVRLKSEVCLMAVTVTSPSHLAESASAPIAKADNDNHDKHIKIRNLFINI